MRSLATSSQSEKFILRFPDGMRDQLREIAAANGRTMNAEIIARLEQSLKPKDISLEAALGHIAQSQALLMSAMAMFAKDGDIHPEHRKLLDRLAVEAERFLKAKAEAE